MSEDNTQSSDTMQERSGASQPWFRVLVEVDRLVLVGVLFVVIVVTLVAAGLFIPSAGGLFTTGDPIETAFQALIGATITGVTLVVTLNQLVLSQELGAVGDQRARMDAAVDFREDVAETLGSSTSPPEPAAFLRSLVAVIDKRAETLRARVADDATVDDDARDRAEALADEIASNADTVDEALAGSQFGTFAVVSAALDFDYSWKLYSARRLRAEHEESLSQDQMDPLNELLAALKLFGAAREHFKTLYFQWELTALSREILAAALPALVVSVAMVLFYDPAVVVGSIAAVPVSLLAVSVAVAVAVVPFLVLLSYVLRITAVTQRTLSIGPFTLRETDRSESIEWE